MCALWFLVGVVVGVGAIVAYVFMRGTSSVNADADQMPEHWRKETWRQHKDHEL